MQRGKPGAVLSGAAVALFITIVAAKSPPPSQRSVPEDRAGRKIKHIIVIMQENRSFDSYFGTFPGADGIPMKNGVPTGCVPDPKTGLCERPYRDRNDKNGGGPHGQQSAISDVNGGKMDGFIATAERAPKGCLDPNDPLCTASATPDVMGYHNGNDIPNYWAYAKNFVLQDHMFEPNASWSLPAHLFMVSGWSALCTEHDNPYSCKNALQNPGSPPVFANPRPTRSMPGRI